MDEVKKNKDKEKIWIQARYYGQPLLLTCEKCGYETEHTFLKSFEKHERIWLKSLGKNNGFSQCYSFWSCDICSHTTQIRNELEYGATS